MIPKYSKLEETVPEKASELNTEVDEKSIGFTTKPGDPFHEEVQASQNKSKISFYTRVMSRLYCLIAILCVGYFYYCFFVAAPQLGPSHLNGRKPCSGKMHHSGGGMHGDHMGHGPDPKM